MILECCTKLKSFDGSIIDINSDQKIILDQAISEMANSALRTIIIAKKELPENIDFESQDQNNVYEFEKSNLTFIALLGIKDVLRKEVPHAISKCKQAGVRVRMVTGDNMLTARAIAIECGIVNPDNL